MSAIDSIEADRTAAMNCTRCFSAVFPNGDNVEKVNFNYSGINGTLNKLNCMRCNSCIYLSVVENVWENIESLLCKRKKKNGWGVIEEKDELLMFFILSQIVCNDIESRCDGSLVFFDFPDETDIVKILWNEGNAIGFYTVKVKDSIVLKTMESYGMTTLDTAFVRKSHRNNGFGLSILEDIIQAFPNENIGISTPISMSMYYVVYKFLELNPSYKSKLWEISGVGSEGERKLIYFTLKKLFNF